MNALSSPFKQLVERKLWPLAVLLVAGLVAVPVLLTKKAEDSGALPVATTTVPAGQSDTDPVVSLADASKTDRVRAVLGARKDPFRPAQINRIKKADDGGLTNAGTPTTVDTGSSSTGDVSSGGGGDVVTTPPVSTPEPTPAPSYELYSLTVRFGPTDGPLKTRTVKRLTALPSRTEPAALYLGLLNDHKTAVFLVDAGTEVLGDGDCEPDAGACQTLKLKVGETEFFTRGGKQWELDLVAIHVKKTTDATAARQARSAEAAQGRALARRMGADSASYRYDSRAGALRKVQRPVAKQSLAHATVQRSATLTSSG